ncbi:unnamed protein product [Lactuca saligna]|uniref:Uncharacterized protein n=1 Tax=Lactuca saligna TaxID=75948 RepID=A0AA36A2Z9_LACSI|nr:unnamed protein product [Lactuca saligna]
MCDTWSSGKVVKRISLGKGRGRYVGTSAACVCEYKKGTRESCSESANGSLSRSEMDKVGFGSGIHGQYRDRASVDRADSVGRRLRTPEGLFWKGGDSIQEEGQVGAPGGLGELEPDSPSRIADLVAASRLGSTSQIGTRSCCAKKRRAWLKEQQGGHILRIGDTESTLSRTLGGPEYPHVCASRELVKTRRVESGWPRDSSRSNSSGQGGYSTSRRETLEDWRTTRLAESPEELVARRIKYEGFQELLTFRIREVSLLTILYPEGFDCVTGRSDMICVISAINGKVIAMRAMINVLCVVYVYGPEDKMLWAGRRKCYGPEGDYVKGRKAGCVVDRKVLTVTRDGTGSIVHTRGRVKFWRILEKRTLGNYPKETNAGPSQRYEVDRGSQCMEPEKRLFLVFVMLMHS